MRRMLAIVILAVSVSSCNITTEEKYVVTDITWTENGYRVYVRQSGNLFFKRSMTFWTKSVYQAGDTVIINLKRQ